MTLRYPHEGPCVVPRSEAAWAISGSSYWVSGLPIFPDENIMMSEMALYSAITAAQKMNAQMPACSGV